MRRTIGPSMKIVEGEMYSKFRQLKPRRLLLIVLVVTSGITAVTASAKFWRRGDTLGPALNTSATQPATEPTTQPAIQSNSKPALTLLPIQLRSTGFARAELTAPAGNFELRVLNASGEPNITLHLKREQEQDNEPETLKSERAKPLRKKVHLRTGVYLLSVVEHPEWVCRLNITEP